MTISFASFLKQSAKHKLVQSVATLFLFIFTASSFAASVNIANSPLVNSTTSLVLPNLMYILDNSGSMDSDFMPDYVNDNNTCKPGTINGNNRTSCSNGYPPFHAVEFNGIAYNPAITYFPGLNANGTDRITMDATNTANWTQVPDDAYGVQATGVTNLVNGYPDLVWCDPNTTQNINDSTQCKANSQYTYPTATFSNGKFKGGSPYFYTVSPGEYCTDATLTNCVVSTVPTGLFTVPSKLRWCNSAALTTCQAKYIDRPGNNATDFIFPKWSGTSAGALASATITLTSDTLNGASPYPLYISGITVDNVSIIATPAPATLTISDTTSSSNRTSLATKIAAAINSFVPVAPAQDFTATSSGSVITIKPVGLGVFTGTLNVDTTSAPLTTILGLKSKGSFTITGAVAPSGIASIKVGNVDILGANKTVPSTLAAPCNAAANSTASALCRNKLANDIVTQINGHISNPDYTAVSDGANNPKITITAVNTGVISIGTLSVNTFNAGSSKTIVSINSSLAGGTNDVDAGKFAIKNSLTQFTGGVSSSNSFQRVDIEPGIVGSPNTFAKADSRTDCGDSSVTSCSYAEEMTNFANWYSYYRTRMQMMKSSTTRAFKLIDTRYRVGFITINNPTATNQSGRYLPVAKFNLAQKTNWYAALTAMAPGNSTPLREALSITGKIFAGKKPVGTADPVEYSCQQNFALLTTDGYWNGNAGTAIDNSAIGNLDAAPTGRPLFEGPIAATGTLADVAKYFYDTDLRSTANANCTGALGQDVCLDNVFVTPSDNNIKQHMTTYALGLGVDGELNYVADYKTATKGDFYNLKQGALNWPVPVADTQTAVDDLWHAAVNGQGTYFSAKDPNQLDRSLNDTLQSIGSKVGAGAAAATSTLNPVSGNNSAYVASYSTVKWIGNLESRSINLNTGVVSDTAKWCVENVLPTTCALPGSILSEDNFGSTVTNCVTPDSNVTSCGVLKGTLVGTDCKVKVVPVCEGKLGQQVLDKTRNIYMKDPASTNSLVDFKYSNFSNLQKLNFDAAFLSSNLSQWGSFSATQQAAATGDNLVNYLRGEIGYEDRASNAPPTVATDKRLFRFREAAMGDALESTPLFIGSPNSQYKDPGYGTATQTGTFSYDNRFRKRTIYIGANDGMLHAINADEYLADGVTANPDAGKERWAYVPSAVIPKMYKLADRTYSVNHQNYVNGDPVVFDVCVANCANATNAKWKSILIGSLNGGGVGYFALDVTDPVAPKLLWEFDNSNDSNLGLGFGSASATKKADGTWVILISSGYNNTLTNGSSNDTNVGKGILYTLNPETGAVIDKFITSAGDATTPSGFAKFATFASDLNANNTAEFVYGGDLQGNLWRFDINAAPSSSNPFKVAILKDSSSPGKVQPITTPPEVFNVGNKRVLFVGTGQYLETNDLTNTNQQTLYAITDDVAFATFDNPRLSSDMVSRTLVVSGINRKIQTTPKPEDAFASPAARGWYIDLPDSGERVNIKPQLFSGTILVATIVPSNTVCSPGGYGYLNYFDYKTGLAVDARTDKSETNTTPAANLVSTKVNAPIVGITVYKIGGKFKVGVVTATNVTPELHDEVPFNYSGGGGFQDRRVNWRELIEQE
jgi:type IV pilus assembly protein PilY1